MAWVPADVCVKTFEVAGEQGAAAGLHRLGQFSICRRRWGSADISVRIGSVTLKNPIMPASGAFSTELAQVMDINRLGALVTKTVSREVRIGNPPPRVAELEGGMINSIGLPGKGLDYFLDHQLPDYKRYTPPIVANITATTPDDFAAMARAVTVPEVDVIEMNISCPTREPGGGNFALHEDHTYDIVRRVRAATDKPVWAKLSLVLGGDLPEDRRHDAARTGVRDGRQRGRPCRVDVRLRLERHAARFAGGQAHPGHIQRQLLHVGGSRCADGGEHVGGLAGCRARRRDLRGPGH